MYKLLDYASQAMWRAVHGITATWKIIRVDRVAKDAGRVKCPKQREKSPPCKTLRSKPQRRGKKQPVLVSEASSTGRASDQYCLTMVTSTGYFPPIGKARQIAVPLPSPYTIRLHYLWASRMKLGKSRRKQLLVCTWNK